jgi:hypothetical protein
VVTPPLSSPQLGQLLDFQAGVLSARPRKAPREFAGGSQAGTKSLCTAISKGLHLQHHLCHTPLCLVGPAFHFLILLASVSPVFLMSYLWLCLSVSVFIPHPQADFASYSLPPPPMGRLRKMAGC